MFRYLSALNVSMWGCLWVLWNLSGFVFFVTSNIQNQVLHTPVCFPCVLTKDQEPLPCAFNVTHKGLGEDNSVKDMPWQGLEMDGL